jgi:hypothetical protein
MGNAQIPSGKARTVAKDLEKAVSAGDAFTVWKLLESGSKVEQCRAVHIASYKGFLEVLNLLLKVKKKTENITIVNFASDLDGVFDNVTHQLSPLCYAALAGRIDVIHVLCDAGANPNGDPKGNTAPPLWYAAENGNYLAVKALLFRGAAIDVKAFDYFTIQIAASESQVSIVRLLATHGGPKVTERLKKIPLGSINVNDLLIYLLSLGIKFDKDDVKSILKKYISERRKTMNPVSDSTLGISGDGIEKLVSTLTPQLATELLRELKLPDEVKRMVTDVANGKPLKPMPLTIAAFHVIKEAKMRKLGKNGWKLGFFKFGYLSDCLGCFANPVIQYYIISEDNISNLRKNYFVEDYTAIGILEKFDESGKQTKSKSKKNVQSKIIIPDKPIEKLPNCFELCNMSSPYSKPLILSANNERERDLWLVAIKSHLPDKVNSMLTLLSWKKWDLSRGIENNNPPSLDSPIIKGFEYETIKGKEQPSLISFEHELIGCNLHLRTRRQTFGQKV